MSAREQGRRRRLTLISEPVGDEPTPEMSVLQAADADIEQSLARGLVYSRTAQIVGGVAGAAALAGVILLIVDAAQRRQPAQRRARLGAHGIEVRF